MKRGRILVTGSRTWVDRGAIEGALFRAWADLCGHERAPTLVHGACPRGADHIADDVWQRCVPLGRIEKHPADWVVLGAQAGFVRNAEMVRLGADLCLAFIKDNSRGASHTANLAEQAGIETRRFTL